MMTDFNAYDFGDWPLRDESQPQHRSFNSFSSQGSAASLLSLNHFPCPPSTATSPASQGKGKELANGEEYVRLELNPAVTISFVRKNRLFKIRYSYIDICKDSSGCLRFLELGGGIGQQSSFVHSFNNTKLPVPHLEQPNLVGETTFRVSFLDEQTVQSAQTVFTTQLSYIFDSWSDSVRFQELLLASKLIFIGGIAEAKSKGRGEECISQNIRILKGRNDRQVILFFANSQKKERKTYVSIPMQCIDKLEVPKKTSKPVTLVLQPNFDLLEQMKSLTIQFIEDYERNRFCQLVSEAIAR